MRNLIPALAVCLGTLLPYVKPVQAQVGPGYIPAPTSYVYYVCLNDPGSFVYVRSEPSRYSSPIGRLEFGTSVNVIRRFVASDGMYWVQINYFGVIAYVRDDYICVYYRE